MKINFKIIKCASFVLIKKILHVLSRRYQPFAYNTNSIFIVLLYLIHQESRLIETQRSIDRNYQFCFFIFSRSIHLYAIDLSLFFLVPFLKHFYYSRFVPIKVKSFLALLQLLQSLKFSFHPFAKLGKLIMVLF
jgi:hypothetical protein